MPFKTFVRVVLWLTTTVVSQSPLVSVVTNSNSFFCENLQVTDGDIATLGKIDGATFEFPLNQVISTSACKTFPTDVKWPSASKWARLNTYTGGALIKTTPLAAPCYPGPSYNADKCSYITSNWGNSSLHMSDPTSMMSPLWQGRTCEPPTIFPSSSGNCTLGGYPSYAINISTVAQIQLGINFARNNNIRLVVKNTGHDFLGKSGGAGSLSIWTHNLKDIRYYRMFVQDGGGYKGPAFHAGSGVQAWEIYEAASKRGLVVVGGEGRTVGVMGGYIQGGGHSPLSSIFGMAADQVLSYNVVLANGSFITASPTKYPNIFWALRGGGGSTFGVVTSVVVKAYPDFPVTSLSFGFGVSDTVSYDNFWAGVRAYFNYFIPFSDAGTYGYFHGFPGAAPFFNMQPFFAPNMTVTQTKALLAPWFAELTALNISISPTFTQYPNYLSAWEASFPQETIGSDNNIFSSRLFPRSNWLSKNTLSETFTAWKTSVDAGFLTVNFNMAPRFRPSPASPTDTTAVLPAWRETVLHAIQIIGWASDAPDSDILATRQLLTKRARAWKDVSPGAGSYLGEADREEEGFQSSFYGVNYGKLKEVKGRVDPWDVFWVKTGVGSEGWAVRGGDVLGDENGVLCRVG